MNDNVSDFTWNWTFTGMGGTYVDGDHLESVTQLLLHEGIYEIIQTIIHEDIHRVLFYEGFCIEKEHRAILIIQWAEEYL